MVTIDDGDWNISDDVMILKSNVWKWRDNDQWYWKYYWYWNDINEIEMKYYWNDEIDMIW